MAFKLQLSSTLIFSGSRRISDGLRRRTGRLRANCEDQVGRQRHVCLRDEFFGGGKNTVFEEFRSFGVNFFRIFWNIFLVEISRSKTVQKIAVFRRLFLCHFVFSSLFFFFRINLRCYVVNLWIIKCQVHLFKQGNLTETEGSMQLTSLYELVEI